MKDWPITYRLAVLVLLLFLLSVILRQFFVGSEELPNLEGAGDDGGVASPRVEFSGEKLYPEVPAVLPDLNENYLFNSERSFAEEERGGGSFSEVMDLTAINYTGSLIVGQIRVGLITYQDEISVAGASPAAARGGNRRRVPTKTVTKNKQLAVGENFMGYVVEEIAKDRLVLKKGDEMIVKFLYDSDTDREGVGEAIRSQPGQNSALTGLLPPRRSPASLAPGPRQNNPGSGPTAPADHDTAGDNKTIRSRSELLRGLDPNFGAPPSSGGPGDPLRR
ncbi:MAG: hypothetical protein ABR523_00375 [Desulfurivibrionaceae bacterium]